MKKLVLCLALLFAFFLSAETVLAKPVFQAAEAGNPVSGEAKRVVSVPGGAVEKAPGLFSLGLVIKNGQILEGWAIVDYKEAPVKPGSECGNGICEPGENERKCPQDCGGVVPDDPCYAFLGKEVRWRTIESYLVNPQNGRGLDEGFVFANLAADIEKWESAAGVDILGAGSLTTMSLVADMVSPDGLNEIYFGDIAEPGAIGVTVIWGVFRGAPSTRQLVEWDQVYDEVDFDWSASGEPGKMDFGNIATHELGHSVGMADLYDGVCAEQTMYGYADYGETKKRSLELGDTTGIAILYQ